MTTVVQNKIFACTKTSAGFIDLANGESGTAEYGPECLRIMGSEGEVVSIATQKSDMVTDGSLGLHATALSPLKLALRKKTQLVSIHHDTTTGAITKTDVLNNDWPKGKLSLSHHNN